MKNKIVTVEAAIGLIKDGVTVASGGSGGGVLEATLVLKRLEEKFLATGHPCRLTYVHASGLGDKKDGGTNRFAHEGMVKRVIGGHWGWSTRMMQLANENKIEAYNLSQGVMTQLYREIAAHRPGLITHIGLKTFVDPRVEGGKLNTVTREDIVEVIDVKGTKLLLYKAFPIDVAIIRGTTADEYGNITMEEEAVYLETLALAQAARNSGGKVICQVKYLARAGTLSSREVKIPGILVDAVVVDENQRQSVEGEYNPGFAGRTVIPTDRLQPMELDVRKVVARRAAMELKADSVVNLGFGMADGVATIAAEEGFADEITFTIEQGLIGGVPARGVIFGVATNYTALLDEPAQFDFYNGGGLDCTFLGLAQCDRAGNVNVSKFGPTITGSGGFIDISQSAKKAVFCGTFTGGGLAVAIREGKLEICSEGRFNKFVAAVEQITFSGEYAGEKGQEVLYITERAVFKLTDGGVALIEIAPGVDIERDILALMDFKPIIKEPLKTMDGRIFCPEVMGLGKEIRS